ncbi:MAG: transporter [Bacteroidales bacterium]|nr:transporter [Bacteroidales bacterium]
MAALWNFLKRWILPIAMLAGAALYFLYRALPFLHPAGPALVAGVGVLQPMLIFSMLFLSFVRISPGELRPHRWQFWLLLFQCVLFVLVALAAIFWVPAGTPLRLFLECFMICTICPTATAAVVVTARLGGDIASLVTYTVLINLATSVLIPLFVPLIHPVEGMSFFTAFSMILAKVFPLLLGPCLLAWLVRYLLPKLHRRLCGWTDLGFYLWTVSLTLAITMTVRALFQSNASASVIGLIALASALSCFLNFAAGKMMGSHYLRLRPSRTDTGRKVSVTQSVGQKNTVFAIWTGYTFFSPVTSAAGGLYSIWQNSFNAWQLEQKRKNDKTL